LSHWLVKRLTCSAPACSMQPAAAARPAPPAPGALTEQQHQDVLSALTVAQRSNMVICLCLLCTAKAAAEPVLGTSFLGRWLLLRTDFIKLDTCRRHWRGVEDAGDRHVSAERMVAMLESYRKGCLDLNGKPITAAAQRTAAPLQLMRALGAAIARARTQQLQANEAGMDNLSKCQQGHTCHLPTLSVHTR
jgi:hypothetical protein